MPKWTRNNCKNGKQTSLLVKGARSAKQKYQTTVCTSKLSKQQSFYHTSEQRKLSKFLRQTSHTI